MIQKTTIFIFLLSISIIYTYAGPDNIATQAKVTASSFVSPDFKPSKVIDGHISILNIDEWVSKSTMTFWGQINYPWIQLDWDSIRNINKIILYDRPTEESHIAGGILKFSDGSKIDVLQIPNDGTPKVISFPSKSVEWVRFEVTDADGVGLGFSEIEIYPSPTDYSDYISWVDPYIETTRGRYFFFVTGSRPFGMISSAPMTRNKNQYGGGYNYNSMEILGFPQIHAWMLSGLTLMPTVGNVDPAKGEQHWKSRFSHDGEIVQPGYHRLYLNDYNIWVEQTVTDRVSLYRLTFTKDAKANLILNLGGYLSTSTMTNARVKRVSNTELEGSFTSTGRLWGGPENVEIFFVAHFDRPFEELDGWTDTNKYDNISELKGSAESIPRREEGWSYHDAPTAGITANYHVKAGEKIHVKFSISYTSIENARNNLNKGCNHWDFDKVKKSARE